jgi:hypothetical protein
MHLKKNLIAFYCHPNFFVFSVFYFFSDTQGRMTWTKIYLRPNKAKRLGGTPSWRDYRAMLGNFCQGFDYADRECPGSGSRLR